MDTETDASWEQERRRLATRYLSLLRSNKFSEETKRAKKEFEAHKKKGKPSTRRAGNPVCEEGHALTMHFTPDEGWSCDICSRYMGARAKMWGCRVCDWDACDDCKTSGRCAR